MAISHVKTNGVADFTGTVTVFNSQGSTATANATDLLRPSDWNSVHNQYLTLTGNTLGASTLSGTNLVIGGGNNVTLSRVDVTRVDIVGPVTAAQTVESQTLGISNLGNTSGTSGVASGGQVRILFAGGNNITLSQSLNGASATVTISAPPISSLVAGNNVSLSSNGSTVTIRAMAAAVSLSGNSTSAGGGYSNVSSGTLVLAGGNNITLSQNGASVTISAPNTAAQSNQSLGIYGSSQTTGQSSSSTVDARSITFVGQGNISVGMSGGSVLISGAGGGGGAAISAAGSSVSNGTVVFSNSNNVTFGMNGSTVTASAANTASTFVAGISTNGNTAGTTGFVSQSLMFVGGNNITLSGSVNGQSMTVTIVGAAGGGGAAKTMLSYQPRQLGASTTTQWTNNQIWALPFRIDPGFAVSASTLMYMQSLSGTYTSAATAQHGQTMKWCLYSQQTDNLSAFGSMSSGSFTWQVWNSGTSSGSWAYNGLTSSSAGTGVMTQANGVRMMNIPLNFSITEGLYLMAMMASSSSAAYSALVSRYGMYMDAPALIAMGSGFGSATATSIGFGDAGSYGTTTTAFPSVITITQIRQHSNLVPFFELGGV